MESLRPLQHIDDRKNYNDYDRKHNKDERETRNNTPARNVRESIVNILRSFGYILIRVWSEEREEYQSQ